MVVSPNNINNIINNNNNMQNNQTSVGANMTQQSVNYHANNTTKFSDNYEVKEELGK